VVGFSVRSRLPLFAGVLAGLALASITITGAFAAGEAGNVIAVNEAHGKALAGEVVLVDVRSSAEWQQTGVPASAYAITMHQDVDQFVAMVSSAMGGDKTRPLAVICATGSRTTFLQTALKRLGFSNPMNVAAGMMGSRFGTGWIKSGLPVRPWGSAADTAPTASGN